MEKDEVPRPNWCLEDTVVSIRQVSGFILAALLNVRGSKPHLSLMRKGGHELLLPCEQRSYSAKAKAE